MELIWYESQMFVGLLLSTEWSFCAKSMLDLHISELYIRMPGSGRHNEAFMAASEFADTEINLKKNASAEESMM